MDVLNLDLDLGAIIVDDRLQAEVAAAVLVPQVQQDPPRVRLALHGLKDPRDEWGVDDRELLAARAGRLGARGGVGGQKLPADRLAERLGKDQVQVQHGARGRRWIRPARS